MGNGKASRALVQLRRAINDVAPGLRFCGLGVFLAWSSVSYGIELSSNAAMLGVGGPGFFLYASSFGLAATILGYLIIPSAGAKRALCSPALLMLANLAAAVAVVLLAVFNWGSPAASACAAFVALLTGLASGLQLIWASKMLSRLSSKKACIVVLGNMALLLVLRMVIVAVPDLAQALVSACLLPAGALLFLLDDSCANGRPACESAEAIKEGFGKLWRFCLVAFAVVLVFAFDVSLFASEAAADAGFVALAASGISLLVVGALLAGAMLAKRANFVDILYPATIALVAVASSVAFLGDHSAAVQIACETGRFLTQAYFMVTFCCLAQLSRSSTASSVLFGVVSCTLGDMIGRAIPSLAQLSSTTRLTVMAGVLLAFLVMLVLLVPKSYLVELAKPAQAAPGEIQGERAKVPWRERCQMVADEFELTPRELKVLVLLSRGNSAKRIAETLYVSEATVRSQTRSIYTKLDVHSRDELIEFIESRG